MSLADDTELTITGIDLVPFSSRGLTQTLEPIDQSKVLKRTVNGALVDVSQAQFRKYKSTITCTDREAPALSGIYPGQEVTVGCIAAHKPTLTMLVVSFTTSFDEWNADNAWQLELEEV